MTQESPNRHTKEHTYKSPNTLSSFNIAEGKILFVTKQFGISYGTDGRNFTSREIEPEIVEYTLDTERISIEAYTGLYFYVLMGAITPKGFGDITQEYLSFKSSEKITNVRELLSSVIAEAQEEPTSKLDEFNWILSTGILIPKITTYILDSFGYAKRNFGRNQNFFPIIENIAKSSGPERLLEFCENLAEVYKTGRVKTLSEVEKIISSYPSDQTFYETAGSNLVSTAIGNVLTEIDEKLAKLIPILGEKEANNSIVERFREGISSEVEAGLHNASGTSSADIVPYRQRIAMPDFETDGTKVIHEHGQIYTCKITKATEFKMVPLKSGKYVYLYPAQACPAFERTLRTRS